MLGYRHLIECHCVLQVYKDKIPPVYHKFTVYSKVNDRGDIIPKYANCNNCGVTHFITEICKSEIKTGKEDMSSVRSIDDLKISLPERLSKILDDHQCDITLYENAEDVIENQYYPYEMIVKREIIDDEHHVKILNIENENKFRIDSQVIKTIIRS
jgi:hypothetical protein